MNVHYAKFQKKFGSWTIDKVAHTVLFVLLFTPETVHALMACNAGTELTCISNIEDHVKMQNMPVLPYILRRCVPFESFLC